MTTRTTYRERTAQDRVALDTAYELGVAKQQIVDMEQRLRPPSLRKQLMSLVWMALIAGFVLVVFWAGEYRGLTASGTLPMPTAAVSTPTRSYPTPRQDSPGAAAPAPEVDYGITTYNATQEARAAAFVAAEDVVEPASEAEIEEWLAAPVSTATPLPGPGEAGFAPSFEDASCSAFVSYIPGSYCAGVAATALAAGE